MKSESGQLAVVLGMSVAIMAAGMLLWKNFDKMSAIQRLNREGVNEFEAKELIFTKIKSVVVAPSFGLNAIGNCADLLAAGSGDNPFHLIRNFNSSTQDIDQNNPYADEPTIDSNHAHLNWNPNSATTNIINCGGAGLDMSARLGGAIESGGLGVQSIRIEMSRSKADRFSLSSKLLIRVLLTMPRSREVSETRAFSYGISSLERFGLILVPPPGSASNPFSIASNASLTVNASTLVAFKESERNNGLNFTHFRSYLGQLFFNQPVYTTAEDIQSTSEPVLKEFQTIFPRGIETNFSADWGKLPLWNEEYPRGISGTSSYSDCQAKWSSNNTLPAAGMHNWRIPIGANNLSPSSLNGGPAGFACNGVPAGQVDFNVGQVASGTINIANPMSYCETGGLSVIRADAVVRLNMTTNSRKFCGLVAAKEIVIETIPNEIVEIIGQFVTEKITVNGSGEVAVIDPRLGYTSQTSGAANVVFRSHYNDLGHVFAMPILGKPAKLIEHNNLSASSCTNTAATIAYFKRSTPNLMDRRSIALVPSGAIAFTYPSDATDNASQAGYAEDFEVSRIRADFLNFGTGADTTNSDRDEVSKAFQYFWSPRNDSDHPANKKHFWHDLD